jgi:hypothetical protein
MNGDEDIASSILDTLASLGINPENGSGSNTTGASKITDLTLPEVVRSSLLPDDGYQLIEFILELGNRLECQRYDDSIP